MKIAIFTDCYLDLTGGIRTSIDAQKSELEKRGHTVYIFTSSFPRPAEELKLLAKKNIFPVPSCRLCFRGLTPVSRRPAIVEQWIMKYFPEIQDFDIFYLHYEAGVSIAGLHLGRALNIPTVQVMHGREDVGETQIIPFGFRSIVAFLLNWFHSWYIPHEKIITKDNYLANSYAKTKMWTLMVNHANYADLVITPSEHFKKKLVHYGVDRVVKVFPNSLSESHYPANPKVKTLKPGQTIHMIWHSRVSAEKRIIPFLKALDELDEDYQLDVYGNGGDYFRAKRFASLHRLNVVFHGNTDFKTISVKLPKSHLDILASYNFDTFGMALIEAEAAGVPVFFCDPDMKEVVPKGSYVLSKNETPEEMANALSDLIEHPERIQKMSEVMLAHREEVLISHRIETLEKIFESVLFKKPKNKSTSSKE